MLLSNTGYRLFFKKLTNLGGRAIGTSQLRTRAFTLNRDLLKKTSSTFQVLDIPSAIENGDIVGLYDSFGTIIFTGVITYIDDNSIQANQIVDIFEDSWLWNNPKLTTLEATLQRIIQNDFQNNPDVLMSNIFSAFNLQTISSTRQKFQTQENRYVTDFSTYLYDVYEKYSIQLLFDIPFEMERPTIRIGIPTYPTITISDNTSVFRNFKITTNIFETNKLIVYSEETGQYRETWYATTNGITNDPASLNRLQKINTNIVFSDDDINILKASSLRNDIYNHEIVCDMIYNNKLLPIEQLKLGQQVELYYKGKHYRTILTGYTMKCDEKSNVDIITLKFGLVRTSLTGKLFKRLV